MTVLALAWPATIVATAYVATRITRRVTIRDADIRRLDGMWTAHDREEMKQQIAVVTVAKAAAVREAKDARQTARNVVGLLPQLGGPITLGPADSRRYAGRWYGSSTR